jgi:hypothetical protein
MREMTCEQSKKHALVSTLRECDPSEEDTKATKLLFEAGKILGIALLDHLIFTPDKFFSFKDNATRPMPVGKRVSRKGVKRHV